MVRPLLGGEPCAHEQAHMHTDTQAYTHIRTSAILSITLFKPGGRAITSPTVQWARSYSSSQNAFLGNAISIRLAVNARPVHVIGPQGDNGLPQKSKREEQTQTHNSSYDAMGNQRMAELMADYRPCILRGDLEAYLDCPSEVQKQGAPKGSLLFHQQL